MRSLVLCAIFAFMSIAMAQPLSACDMCRITIECNPNCETVERCRPANRFPQAGGDCFYSMLTGCTVTNFCGWADLDRVHPDDLVTAIFIDPPCVIGVPTSSQGRS